MPEKTSRFINVDELMPQATVEQAAAFYGIDMGPMHEVGKEIRTRCFLTACENCDDTGDRAVAIDTTSPISQWKCHQYGCGRGGNLLSMMDLMKPGDHCNGRPRGGRFKELAGDLRAIVNGETPTAPSAVVVPQAPRTEPPTEPTVNTPLAESDKPAARALVTLHEKLLVEPDEKMNKYAAAYLRKRPYLTPDVCREWQCGYLPHDAGGDKSGGTLRGRFIYPMKGEDGRVLAWFGRDPQWEEKHAAWERGGKRKREPNKFTFPKNFHRGLELFGQDRFALASGEVLEQVGIVVVEGPNDVIALQALGVPSLGICTNRITDEQVRKLASWSCDIGVPVTVMFDNDVEGEAGAKQAVWKIAEHCPVRLAWSPAMLGGKFRNRQPESLTVPEWDEIRTFLAAEQQVR